MKDYLLLTLSLLFAIIAKIQIKHPICMAVICNDRPALFRQMLTSLLNAHGIVQNGLDNIFVSQSGDDKRVASLVTEFGLQHHYQHVDYSAPVKNRLARHFNWTLSKLFKENRHCDGFVILEDDLLLSPDFLEYFKLTIPVVDADTTLLTTSLWNDIGYKYNTNNPHAIRRTSFFPGLGWYMSRRVWEELLGPNWPSQDWDWYVRVMANRHKLDVLVPEIPRDFHNSKTGTYMTTALFNRYFRDINMHTDKSFRWDPVADVAHLALSDYVEMVKRELSDSNNVVLWVDGFHGIRNKRQLGRKCSAFLRDNGFWEGEMERGGWRGVHRVWSRRFEKYLYVVDVNGEFGRFKPPHVVPYKGLSVCEWWETTN